MTEVTTQTQEVAIVNAQTAAFQLIQRRANVFAKSSMVPKDFQNNLPNCIIAVEMAERLGYNPIMVMQNLYIVHGRPAWSSQFLIAAINGCGKFKPLQFDISGEGDDYGCTAWTEDNNGQRIESIKITIGMAKKEGWWSRKDKLGKETSKWPTMTEQMLRYRAAAFFGRIYAPDILMGIYAKDEVEDFTKETKDVTPRKSFVEAVKQKAEPVIEAKPEPVAEPIVVEPIKEELKDFVVDSSSDDSDGVPPWFDEDQPPLEIEEPKADDWIATLRAKSKEEREQYVRDNINDWVAIIGRIREAGDNQLANQLEARRRMLGLVAPQ